jgi:hypothetical protein
VTPSTSSEGPQAGAPIKPPSTSVADILAAARGEKKQGTGRDPATSAGDTATSQPAEQLPPKAKAKWVSPASKGLPDDVPEGHFILSQNGRQETESTVVPGPRVRDETPLLRRGFG